MKKKGKDSLMKVTQGECKCNIVPIHFHVQDISTHSLVVLTLLLMLKGQGSVNGRQKNETMWCNTDQICEQAANAY